MDIREWEDIKKDIEESIAVTNYFEYGEDKLPVCKEEPSGDDVYGCWCSYDIDDNLILYRTTNGLERICKYSDNGRTYAIDNNGFEEWYEYDDKGKFVGYSNTYHRSSSLDKKIIKRSNSLRKMIRHMVNKYSI